MKQTQLIELIQVLTSKEKEQILHFANLPFFPKSKIKSYVGPLLKLCLNHRWENPNEVLEKGDVYRIVFPGQKLVAGKLEKVMVEAQKVIRSYLLSQNFFKDENEFQQEFDFAEIIRLRGLDTRYKQQLAKLKKMQDEFPWKTASYFYKQFQLENAIHEYESLHNQVKGDLNVPNVLNTLELFYFSNRLALLNRFQIQQKAANIEAPPTIKPLLQETIVPERFLNNSAVLSISHAIFGILKKGEPQAADAQGLFDLILLNQEKLDIETQREFYTYLRNICVLVLLTDSEQEDIYNTLFALYKDNLERGFLHYEGKLAPSRYLAISEYAARLGEHEWAYSFIEKHKHEITGDNETQDIYRLNLAFYLFGIGEYSACLDNIPGTSPYTDYLIAGKRLELKALYELKSDLLPYKLDAFKMFLSRTSRKLLTVARRQMNLDFFNLLLQLSISIPGDKTRAQRLIERITAKKQAAEYRWLLAKAQQLGGEKR